MSAYCMYVNIKLHQREIIAMQPQCDTVSVKIKVLVWVLEVLSFVVLVVNLVTLCWAWLLS